jgi:protein subunit release factor B
MFCRWRLVTTLRQYCLSTPLVTATIPSVTTSHIVSQSSIQSYRIFHPWSIWSRYLVTSPETAIQNTSDASKPTESSKPSRPKPRQRIEIHINEEDLIEKFVRGSGPGGQKINKTNNCVDLLHVPTGIRIKVSKIIETTFYLTPLLVSSHTIT